jgi:hypothetical protein
MSPKLKSRQTILAKLSDKVKPPTLVSTEVLGKVKVVPLYKALRASKSPRARERKSSLLARLDSVSEAPEECRVSGKSTETAWFPLSANSAEAAAKRELLQKEKNTQATYAAILGGSSCRRLMMVRMIVRYCLLDWEMEEPLERVRGKEKSTLWNVVEEGAIIVKNPNLLRVCYNGEALACEDGPTLLSKYR